MKRRIIAAIATVALVLAGLLPGPADVRAQAMADYAAFPVFIGSAVPPNILLLLDNSGSMNTLAYETAFDPTKTYFGLFDPLECYDYASNKFIPDTAANPTTLGTCVTSPYLWSGNLLNWGTMRRIDIVKWVMMGGTCSVGGRDAQGNCRQLLGQSTFGSSCCLNQTHATTPALATGLMPASLIPPGAGDKVNFHLMGSISLLKGSFCLDNDSTPPGSSSCSDSDDYGETNWQIRVDTLENATGIIQEVGSKARFGLMEFKGAGDGGKVLSDVGGNVQNMITAIESTTPSTWTPLGESLYEATRYYAQVPPAYTNSDYSYTVTNRDPYYFQAPQWASTSQYVTCCRSFVIIFTDGEPTQDLNVPAGLQDYAHSVHGAHCTGTPCTPHKTDYPFNGSHYLDDVAYYAHTTDLRQATLPVINEAGKDLAGMQTLTVYSFFAFGSGSELLKSAAKAGGFEDRNGNNLPDLAEEWDRVNNDTGAAGADGIPDTYYESSDADKLHDRLLAAITSILQRSGSGSSLSVLASSSTGEGAVYQAFFYPRTVEGLIDVKWTGYTQGLFVDAFGNLREDSSPTDGKLILAQDKIVNPRYDSDPLSPTFGSVLVDRFADANGDGKADSATPTDTVGLTDMSPIWEAGKQLALKDPATRRLLTWVDADNDGLVDAGEQMDFSTANSATLAPYLRAEASPSVFTADNIINFIRGTQVAGLRNRELTVAGAKRVWKLGDVIHASPVVVAAPKERFDVLYSDGSYTAYFQKYKNRRQMAYVGANDGMLHAFNVGYYHRGDDPSTTSAVEHGWFTRTPTDNSGGPALGEEKWGFLPYQLLPHLRWLAQPDYTHVYYVDLKPRVTDARIFTPDATHPNGWGTILIGGFRLGGSCGSCAAGTGAPPMTVTADFGSGLQTRTFLSAYFVLDITDPDAAPTLLWSFTDPTLGLTTSYPTVLRVNPAGDAKADNTNAKWFVVVGSGMTGYDGSSAQSGTLFALEMPKPYTAGSGLVVSTFSTNEANAFLGDPVALDADLDFRVDAVYLGTTRATGSAPAWAGTLYRLTTGPTVPFGGATTPAAWGIAAGATRGPTVLLATFACTPAPCTGPTRVGPITAAPTLTVDETNKVWLFFGTGRYHGTLDKTSTDPQHFFGVKDPVLPGLCLQASVSGCERNDLVDVSSASVCVVCTGGTPQVTGVAGVSTLTGTTTATLQGLVASKDGWWTTLPASRERVLVSPTLVGGIVFFPTYTPENNVCSASGSGSLYALFFLTGSAYKESVIGTEASGSNTNVKRFTSLGQGLWSQMSVQVTAQTTDAATNVTGDVNVCSQSSTSDTACVRANLPGAVVSRYLSWLTMRE